MKKFVCLIGCILMILSAIGVQAQVKNPDTFVMADYRTVQTIDPATSNVDLALLKPLIQRCRLLVTNDTGPRHYAVAFDIPVVVIMGPTDPRYTHANLEKTRVLRKELDCSPCHLKECPLEHSCMREISPQAVLQAAEQLVQEQL